MKLDDRSVNRVQRTKTKNQCMHFKTAKIFPRVLTDNLTTVLCQQRPALIVRIPTRKVRGSCNLKIIGPQAKTGFINFRVGAIMLSKYA